MTNQKCFLIFGILISLFLSPAILAQSQNKLEYQIDPAHTQVNFEVPHLVISFVTGKFKQFEGSFQFDPLDFSKTTLVATAQAASVDTGIEKRDEDLRSAHFFYVKKYPVLSFKSNGVSHIQKDQNKFDLTGDLTIRGVTKSVTFHVDYKGQVKLKDKIIQVFRAQTVIDRHDFGLNFQNIIEATPMVGDKVTISIICEGFQKQ